MELELAVIACAAFACLACVQRQATLWLTRHGKYIVGGRGLDMLAAVVKLSSFTNYVPAYLTR